MCTCCRKGRRSFCMCPLWRRTAMKQQASTDLTAQQNLIPNEKEGTKLSKN
jgi:hypothetical protein